MGPQLMHKVISLALAPFRGVLQPRCPTAQTVLRKTVPLLHTSIIRASLAARHFSFLKPLPLEPCALNVTPFCPHAEIPSSSTGSSSHAAAVGPTARVFALHFEASYSQHCQREAAVFGFWEEPARVLLYCAFKMSSSSDSNFAIKAFLVKQRWIKNPSCLGRGRRVSEWSANWLSWRSCTSRQHWRSIAPIAPLQSQESGSLKDPDNMKWISFRDKSALVAVKSASSIR